MKKFPYLPLAIAVLLGFIHQPLLLANTIYTWVDEQGVVHFSDQYTPKAKTVDIKPLPTIKIAPPTAASSSAVPAATQQESEQPVTVRLLSPSDQQTIRDNQGIINITATSSLTLSKSHRAQLLLDGKPYGQPQSRLNWQLDNIDRGSHTLQVTIFNRGKVIASSEVITVYLHRVSRLRSPAITPK